MYLFPNTLFNNNMLKNSRNVQRMQQPILPLRPLADKIAKLYEDKEVFYGQAYCQDEEGNFCRF